MTEPALDAERLAALLDGKLDQHERAELLARLASSEEEEASEAYFDAVAALGELEGGSAAPRRWPAKQWLAIAATLAGIALAPLLWRLARPPAPASADPRRFVALLAARADGLPAGWEGRPWSSVRGGAEPLSDPAASARLGARLVDLDLAIAADDTAAGGIAADVASLVERFGLTPLAGQLRGEVRPDVPPRAVEPLLAYAWRAGAASPAPALVGFAAWAESARIAAARHDLEFFRARDSRLAVEQAVRLPTLPGSAAAELQRLESLLPAGGPPDWDGLENALTALVKALGS